MSEAVTFGVKTTPEIRERVNELVKASGISSTKQWFENVVKLCELEQLKQGAPFYREDLKELQIHTTRIFDLAKNMVTRFGHEKESILNHSESSTTAKDKIITRYQQDIADLEEQINVFRQRAEQTQIQFTESINQVSHLEEVNINNKALISEYKEKINMLTGLVSQFNGYADINIQIEIQVRELEQDLKDRISEFEKKIGQLEQENSMLKNQVAAVESREQAEIKGLNVQHKIALERLEERKDLEKERSVLQVKTEFQDKW